MYIYLQNNHYKQGSTHMLHPNNFLIDLMNLTNDQQNNQPLGGASEQQVANQQVEITHAESDI